MNELSNYFKKLQIRPKMEATEPSYYILSNNYTLSLDNGKIIENGIEVYPETNSTVVPRIESVDLKKLNEAKGSKIREISQIILKEHYKCIAVLLGAGASVQHGEIGEKGKEAPTRETLWKKCEATVRAVQGKIQNAGLDNILKEGEEKREEGEEKDIEKFLSRLNLLIELGYNLTEEKHKIESIIKDECSLPLGKGSPHEKLIHVLTARKASDPRAKIFTTNYDTLIEQAAEKTGCTLIDGFSFSFPRKFSGRYFDYDIVNRAHTRTKNEESFVQRVMHLYKLHGSLNWTRTDTEIIQTSNEKNPLIVYPASNKFEAAFEQPYFEMMSRFQMALRQENLRLLVCGFGFADKHIQNAIIEALYQNPNFQLVINDYNKEGKIDIKKYAELGIITVTENGGISILPNTVIIFSDFSTFVSNLPLNITYEQFNQDQQFVR